MLAPCTSCRRHVRADEPRCPFCGGALGEPTNRAVGRVPRVAVLFAGALGIAGCSAVDDGGAVPVYGAPINDTGLADTSATRDSASDTGASDTAIADTARPDSTPADSAAADTGGAVPPYGAPMEDAPLGDSGDD